VTCDLSVIVIAFNEEARIGACLRSLVNQRTKLDYEILVVDDGSTDGTAKAVEEVAAESPRVRLIEHGTNRGRGAARRTGQDATGASLVGFVDADIEVPDNWIEECADALHTADAVSGIAVPDGDCAVIWRIFQAPIRERHGPAAITGNNVMYRSEALALEPFSERSRLGEDFRQAHRMAKRGLSLRTLSTLKVSHCESRTYSGAFRWMWALGVDAASHPFELGTFRVPDVTWILWLTVTAGTLIAAGVEALPWWTPPLAILTITSIIDCAYIFTRFHVLPNPLRWLGSLMANLPLMCTYLVGRTWGILTLATPSRRRALGL
jgi:hypothetical protein